MVGKKQGWPKITVGQMFFGETSPHQFVWFVDRDVNIETKIGFENKLIFLLKGISKEAAAFKILPLN